MWDWIKQFLGFHPSVTTLPSKLPWTASRDGDDLVVRNITATAFGGKYDKGDNGETESGDINDGSEPSTSYLVALPIRSTEAATRNSPLAFKGPHIPWNTTVMVWTENDGEDTALECKLADNGPDVSRFPDHALDCNPNIVMHFEPCSIIRNIANDWERTGYSYRVIGGAKWIS